MSFSTVLKSFIFSLSTQIQCALLFIPAAFKIEVVYINLFGKFLQIRKVFKLSQIEMEKKTTSSFQLCSTQQFRRSTQLSDVDVSKIKDGK